MTMVARIAIVVIVVVMAVMVCTMKMSGVMGECGAKGTTVYNDGHCTEGEW